MTENFWLGMAIILLGGALNGSFALPMKYSRRWRWENTWLVFALTALLVLPWLLATGFVPRLWQVYEAVPGRAILYALVFGFLWGIAQTTFGLGLMAVGMALAFAVVAGLACLFGSLIPLLVLNPDDLFRPRGILLLVSMPILIAGLALYGTAGRRREKEQSTPSTPVNGATGSFKKGLAICIFTGIFGSNFNLGFAFGGDVLRQALELGANPVTATYALWGLVLGAGSLPNLAYCLFLLFRNRTWSLFRQDAGLRETLLGLVMALLWLAGVVGYGIGATLVGRYGTSLGYALFVAAMILSSNLLGILTGEWHATTSRTRKLLAAAVAVILVSVAVLNVGGVF